MNEWVESKLMNIYPIYGNESILHSPNTSGGPNQGLSYLICITPTMECSLLHDIILSIV